MPGRARASAPQSARGEARFVLHVVPGLEDIALQETRNTLSAAQHLSTWHHFDERTSILEIRYGGSPRDLLRLGTVEDVFVLAARARSLRTDDAGLAELGAAILRSRALDRALAVFAAVHSTPRTFRVVARKAGRHTFRRVDAQRAAERAIRTRFPSSRLVADDADVEFWLTMVEREALLGIRLSTADMRQHGGRLETLSASLKPTVARAMVLLSGPRSGDTVLDPLCGAGTLLVERAAVGAARSIQGGDSDVAAVELARQNVRRARLPIDIQRWDATALPLADGSVSVILSNPPFGKRVPIAGEASAFYARVLAEMERVLAPGGRCVLITSQSRAVQRRWSSRDSRMHLISRTAVIVRGEAATIFVAGVAESG